MLSGSDTTRRRNGIQLGGHLTISQNSDAMFRNSRAYGVLSVISCDSAICLSMSKSLSMNPF